jgi:Ca-activated chloride channel homolog
MEFQPHRRHSSAVRVALFSSFVFSFLVLAWCFEAGRAQQPGDEGSPAPSAVASPVPAATPRRPGGQEPAEVVNTDLVTITVTVTDAYGRFVTGLSRSAFTISDNNVQQEILFFSDEDAPISVGVIFDLSGSMSGDKVARAREALARFIQTSHQGDEYFLIGFNSRAELLIDRTRNSDAILGKLTFVETRGQTALYDACYLGVEKLSRATHRKRALLLISDGQDNNSRYTFSEVRRMLKESDVLIYAIGILGVNDANTSLGAGGQAILDELASISGGRAFFPNTTAEMNEIFERIALELRHQYSIGYRPSNFVADGRWHRIKVKVTPPRGLPRLFVRSKEGYYAITNPR